MLKNSLNWIKKYKIHFIVWALFMLYETVVIGLLFNLYGNPIIYIAHYIVIVSIFYVHANFILAWALRDKTNVIWRLPFIIIIQIILYILLNYSADLILIGLNLIEVKGKHNLDSTFILRNLYRGIYFLGFSTGYYFLSNFLSQRKKTEELEKEKLEKVIQQQKTEQELIIAQNAFLKAQINPHFLFNTLDFIYHKVNMHSEIAGEAVIRLSQMMRYAIDSDEMENTIYLADEIEQVENLIYLYQIRKTNDLNVYFSYTEDVKHLQLIPLVLLTLVENIFKHGDISDDDDIAYINLSILNELLQIQTVNLINHHKVKNTTNSGLNNIHKRLCYAYGNEVSFQYQSIDQHFKANIEIPVKLLKLPI
ncbi:hypothetical protein FA048_07035 [Pedobacter polaris]|uniref:Signal transduction histidine kinase internal region domain-containing protein n=1 Tax=Pedobacter polaris TaxID=2571273 RepID=A0A4U1CVM4_9SPHI|nr:sensor histidine kinase [Pedobacter polaris]TKC09958.1 hypothetical protein FA048_07035 [Pedobacter polaris]